MMEVSGEGKQDAIFFITRCNSLCVVVYVRFAASESLFDWWALTGKSGPQPLAFSVALALWYSTIFSMVWELLLLILWKWAPHSVSGCSWLRRWCAAAVGIFRQDHIHMFVYQKTTQPQPTMSLALMKEQAQLLDYEVMQHSDCIL